MEEVVEIVWSAGSIDEARKIARFLVLEKLVLTAKIIPWVESIVLLDEKLDTDQESLVVMYAFQKEAEKIVERIEKESHFEVPEISTRPISSFNNIFRANYH